MRYHRHYHHWFAIGWAALFLHKLGAGGLFLRLLVAVGLTLLATALLGPAWGAALGSATVLGAIVWWAVR